MQHPDASHVTAELLGTFIPPLKRLQRILGYFFATAFFAHATPYEIDHPWLIAAGVGLLGGATQSARIGQAAMVFFTVMAITPKSVVMYMSSL
ncbi:hypothetical protein EV291_14118 [Rhizobium sp. BK068]|nr:hypothetical protein EV291_14118 [Rhizobium sp. BK068]